MNRTGIRSAARSICSRRGLRAVAVAGALAATVGTAGAASAATAHHVRPAGWAPVEQCLTWSGTIKYFPALTNTAKSVNAVISGTASNCNLDGTQQTLSASFFGNLTGSANKTKATLNGQVAITWPADANPPTGLEPTISNLNITTANGTYSFASTISGGAFAGNELWGSFVKTQNASISGGTSQTIVGTQPFEVEENLG